MLNVYTECSVSGSAIRTDTLGSHVVALAINARARPDVRQAREPWSRSIAGGSFRNRSEAERVHLCAGMLRDCSRHTAPANDPHPICIPA